MFTARHELKLYVHFGFILIFQWLLKFRSFSFSCALFFFQNILSLPPPPQLWCKYCLLLQPSPFFLYLHQINLLNIYFSWNFILMTAGFKKKKLTCLICYISRNFSQQYYLYTRQSLKRQWLYMQYEILNCPDLAKWKTDYGYAIR